jgi:glucose-6-phosphate 1-epimerase
MENLKLLDINLSLDPSIHLYQDASGLKFLQIKNDLCTASMALQGGHVMTWQPKHEKEPVLWLSEHARYVHGRSIRGGVPICWPWFGPHPTDSALCPHGFARVMPWNILETETLQNGATRVLLQILHTPVAQRQLSYPYLLTLEIEFGETLKMKLSTTNRGNQPFIIGEAFHTYFQISDVANIEVTGLENCEYADKVMNYERYQQQGSIKFNNETDRVYVNTKAGCVIEDTGYKRAIRISKSGSNATVVWNPWQTKAHEMGDMGTDDSWRKMVCLETANTMENCVMISPGNTHILAVEYSTESL